MPIPHSPVPSTRYDMKLTGPGGGPVFIGPQMLLPADKVRHVGEAVAVVIAETPAQAQDAAEAVAVEYEELPWIAATQDALTPGAPVVWDEAPDNVLVDTSFGDAGATERAFAAADHIVEMEFPIGRVTGVPIEPRAALGHWDSETGRYTLWAGSGGAVRQKAEIAAVLGVPPEQVRVLSFDVGGNFGTRNRLYVEFGAGAMGVAQARPAGQIHLDPVGGIPHRFSGPRPAEQSRAGVARRRPLSRLCAPTMSAMSAPAAHRCRRSARARPWSPAPTISRRRACGRARSSPTRCRPTPIAARAGPRSLMRSSGWSTRRRAGSASTASRCAG